LKQIHLLNSLTWSQLKKMIKHFKVITRNRFTYLFHENDRASHVYIVKKGEFKITKRIMVPKPSFEEEKLNEIYEAPIKANRHNNHLFLRNTTLETTNLSLGIIGQNNFIGIEDVCNGSMYSVSVQCISQTAELISFPRDAFLNIANINSLAWGEILKDSHEKAIKVNCHARRSTKAAQFITHRLDKVKSLI